MSDPDLRWPYPSLAYPLWPLPGGPMAFDVRRNQPFTIQVEHDQIDTASYVLVENDVFFAEVPVDPAGVQFRFPDGKPPGAYTYHVIAVGTSGLDDDRVSSEGVGWIVGPQRPTMPRLSITIQVT